MKRLLTAFVLPLPVLLSFSSSHAAIIADYPGGSFANGIGESRHNLGSLGQFGKNRRYHGDMRILPYASPCKQRGGACAPVEQDKSD